MKVSVIVPIYNTEKYLKNCLDSLVNQTLEEIEIIAIDDASTDGSLAILKDYEKKYPNKIKVYSNSWNMGQGATRNKGIKLAMGEYIGFLDSDDYVNFGMYKKMYEAAKKYEDPEIVTTGLVFVKNDKYLNSGFKEIFEGKGRIFNVSANPDIVLDESPSVCNKLFRSDTIKKYPCVENRMWEDVAFTYAKMFKAHRILKFNDSDYFYRRRIDGNVSSKALKPNSNLSDIFIIADRLENELREANKYEPFAYYVKFIQISYSLYRMIEVFSWNIDENMKLEICQKMSDLIIRKYGDWRNYPQELMSSKIGIMELEKINAFTDKRRI